MSRSELLQSTAMVQGGFLVVALLLGWGLAIPFWETIRFDQQGWVYGIGLGIALAVFSMIVIELPGQVFSPLKRDADLAFKTLGPLGYFEILLISIAAGVSEEMFFRGLLQPLFAQWTGEWVAIVLVSALFGVMHFISYSYVLYAILFGTIFGLLYVWTGNLLTAILAHLVYDFVFLIWGIHIRKFHLKA